MSTSPLATHPSRWQRIRYRLRGQRGLQIGIGILIIYLLAATIGPLVVTADPAKQNLQMRAAGPSWSAPFGYDELGRDLFSRVVHGARITIGIALIAVAAGGLAGIIIGGLAGFRRGWVDTVLMRLIDVLLAFPSLIVALAVVATLGAGTRNLIIATAIYIVPQFARLTRATFLGLREQEFVVAATALGAGESRVILRHMLPNSLAPLIVQTSYAVAAVVLTAAGLSFLGLGVQPPSPEWGAMLSRGRDFLRVSPHIVAVPGLAIAFLILALNLTGDGLRNVLDPRLRHR
jgi:peptide/nickel transport system permease protein